MSKPVGNSTIPCSNDTTPPPMRPVPSPRARSGHLGATFGRTRNHRHPPFHDPSFAAPQSPAEPLSDTFPTSEPTSTTCGERWLSPLFLKNQALFWDICSGPRRSSIPAVFPHPLPSPPFFLSSMRRRKEGEATGRSGRGMDGGFCGPRVGYSRGFPWPGSRAARRFVRRGPT